MGDEYIGIFLIYVIPGLFLLFIGFLNWSENQRTDMIWWFALAIIWPLALMAVTLRTLWFMFGSYFDSFGGD
jgi:uncharacterized protein YqgC (DUF456 family)